MQSPWHADGPWLRCSLHAHTTNSDGELAPRALARHYERAGFDVLALTDHWHRSEAPSGDRLLVLAGVELNCLLPGDRDGHVLGLGIERDPSELAGERLELAPTTEWITDAGGVAFLAHPYWTGATPGTLELPETVAGIEVFNAGCELEVGRGLSAVHWDELLEDGRLCGAIATDDSHHPGFDSVHAWTWVRAERTREQVLEALRSGCFYASSGPAIHDVTREADVVEVHSSPVRSIMLVSGRTIGAAVNAGRLGYRHGGDVLAESDEGLVVRAKLRIPDGARHVRVEATDVSGRKAWANPIPV
ncbi:MAG: CehA/McbA family metallohydrolase [Thermoleophilia bacterium]|nr:CehA/McbA family metallohydrolase [Thermoleophilia bacterium]